ncbi:dTDP-4-dehydrorhamnose 3,5-epimerase [candidate division KSB1 bacterium]|nr:dTDP-4-dehydrorhamnose 3,5-epimerase [candidate division KSB1 bacterium]
MPFTFTPLEIPAVLHIEIKQFGDARGFFQEVYKRSEFEGYGINSDFVQDNHSHSVRGVLRGLHYQKAPDEQGKLVRVLQGQLYDVAVDIRQNSPTYGQWVAETLSGDRPEMLYIPPGFAHGFCVLSETVDFMYKCTAEYAFNSEAGILWNDPAIRIDWPIDNPLLSEKDTTLPLLKDSEDIGLTYP